MAHRVQSVSMIDQNILQAIFIGGEVIQYDLRKQECGKCESGNGCCL